MKKGNLKALLRFSGYVFTLAFVGLPLVLAKHGIGQKSSMDMVLTGAATLCFPAAVLIDYALRNAEPWFPLPFQRLLRLSAAVAWLYVCALWIGVYLTVHHAGGRS